MGDSDSNTQICRLCLDITPSCESKPIKDVQKEKLKVLPFKIDFYTSIIDDAFACKRCLETLQEWFDFKISCSNTCMDVNFKTTIKKKFWHSRSSGSICQKRSRQSRACWLCLSLIEVEAFDCTIDQKEGILLEDMIRNCFPKVHLNAGREILLCQQCLSSMKKYYKFTKICQEVDQRIEQFREMYPHGTAGRVILEEVLKFKEYHVFHSKSLAIRKECLDVNNVDENAMECLENVGTASIKCEEINIKEELDKGVSVSDVDELDVSDSFEEVSLSKTPTKVCSTRVKEEEEDHKRARIEVMVVTINTNNIQNTMGSKKTCRLCLRLIYESNSVAVGEITKYMVSALCLKLNFDITKEPVVCTDCINALQACCDFKWPYIRTRKNLIPSIYCADDTTNLLDVCFKQDEDVTLNVSRICQKVCRFCYRGANGCFTNLYGSSENMQIVETLSTHIPEVTLMKTEDLITCEPCLNTMKHFSNFILQCKDVEDKIRKYAESTDAQRSNLGEANGSAFDVLQVIAKNGEPVDEGTLTKTGAPVKNELNMEYLTDEEDVDMQIKREEIFIKPEDRDSDREETSEVSEESEENEVQEYKCEPYPNEASEGSEANEVPEYKCELCPYVGKRNYYLKLHMRRHNRPRTTTVSTEVQDYKCKSYPNETSEGSEENEVLGYKCELCPYVSKRKYYLKAHMRGHKILRTTTVSTEAGTRMYKCNLCSYQATKKKYIDNHMLLHKDSSEAATHRYEFRRGRKSHLRSRQNFPKRDKKRSAKLRKEALVCSNKHKALKALTCDLCLGTGHLKTFT